MGIYVEKCTGLKDADWIGKTDPYCYCSIDDAWSDPVQTETIENSVRPEWNQELTMTGIQDPLKQELKLVIYDDDWLKDDKIGKTTIQLSELVMGQRTEFKQVVDTKFF